jgi:hypothetical protein
MKTMLSLTTLSLSALLATCALACASSSANDTKPSSSTAAATATQAEPSALAGTWAFALSSSDVAAPLRDRCEKSSNSDASKAKACWDEIATEAAHEKIRFANDGAGHTLWTSFGTDGSKETVFVQVPVELAADGPGHVLAKVSGAAKGEMAGQFAKSSINVMRIEVVDAHTIAMTDPKKGRLVYTKE